LTAYYEYTKELMSQSAWILVGEIMYTSKGKYRITDIESGYNEKINQRDWIYIMLSYENNTTLSVWYTDLYDNYTKGKMVFIRF